MRTEAHPITESLTHDAIARAMSVAVDRDETAAVERLGELLERLRSSSFYLAVLGEFNRGKSTLVNAILGLDVLPTGVLPLTSVVTRVRWGAEPGVGITFASGEHVDVGLERLAEFVTEEANPGNRAAVAEVDVHVRSDLLRTGVVLIDTPGVGSILAHNTDATMRLLPDLDAALFVTATNPPISTSERVFLHAVREQARRIFFVLNKADDVLPAELDEIVRFTRGVIADALDHPVELTAVSARRWQGDGDAGLDTLKGLLSDFLMREMAGVGATSLVFKAREVVNQLHAGVVLQLQAGRLSSGQLTARRERLEVVRHDVDRSRVGIKASVRSDVAKVVESIERDLAAWRTDETQSLYAAARGALSDPNAVAPEELNGFVKMRLRQDIEAWRPSAEAKAESAWRDLSARSAAEVDVLAARAVDACSQVLEIALPPPPAMDGSLERSRFSYSFFEVPTLGESLIPDLAGVLPSRSGGKLALRRVSPKIPLMVDRHSGRMRHDLASRLNESCDHLLGAIDRHLDALTQGLASALDRAIADLETDIASRQETAPGLTRLADELTRLANLLEEEAG